MSNLVSDFFLLFLLSCTIQHHGLIIALKSGVCTNKNKENLHVSFVNFSATQIHMLSCGSNLTAVIVNTLHKISKFPYVCCLRYAGNIRCTNTKGQ